MKNDELKPCPFCGSIDLINDADVIEGASSGFVECLSCHVIVRNGRILLDALHKWNQRVDALQSVREKIEDEISKRRELLDGDGKFTTSFLAQISLLEQILSLLPEQKGKKEPESNQKS